LSTPQTLYRQALEGGTLEPDPGQAAVVERLDDLHHRLLRRPPASPPLLRRLVRRSRHTPPEKGLYVWGGVGRGKTWLVDLFYNQLPLRAKRRTHFHRFMRDIHERLTGLKGEPDPLRKVAARIAGDTRLLCLDEFVVLDIGDAMILARLLDALFDEGITLVTTSNTPPDRLYPAGIQRASFLPAIDLLKRHTDVVELVGKTDYRLRFLEQATVYHTPVDAGTRERLLDEFDRLAPEAAASGGHVRVLGREIAVVRCADDVVWFDFMALCGPPRSQADYLEIARCFHTVFITDIPVLGPALDDATRRFLHLVDVFYDRGVKLILSAAAPPESLYQGERLAFDFQRAASRLREMQSGAYLGREHRP